MNSPVFSLYRMIALKKVFLIIISLLLIFINAGCTYIKPAGSNNIQEVNPASDYGSITKMGDWLYTSGKISKVRTDGKDKTSIGNAYGRVIYADGKWIYYYNGDANTQENKGIFKTNGSKVIRLSDDVNIYEAVYYKGLIYYALYSVAQNDKTEKSGFYKIDSDGKNKIEISDQQVSDINIYHGWIYYFATSPVLNGDVYYPYNDEGIFKIKTDGTEKTKIYDKPAYYLRLYGEYIYFSNPGDNDKIYRIKTDGTDIKKINDDNVSIDIEISDGWIYYSKNPYSWRLPIPSPPDQTKGNIYKITIDGNERTKLNSVSGSLTEVLDGWIYFRILNDHKLHRMKLDGSSESIVDWME